MLQGLESQSKSGPTNKRNATDRTEDINQENFYEKEDEGADDTVFIDNLPKDELSLKTMIKEVNKQIRELEKKFFEEEDSEVE